MHHSPTDAPGRSTDRRTTAPAPTVAPSPTIESVTTADGWHRAPGCTAGTDASCDATVRFASMNVSGRPASTQ